MSEAKVPKKYPPRVVDEEFAKRLAVACDNHPLAPPVHGRQIWLRNKVAEEGGHNFSIEAVRKWFGGQARPRPQYMKIIAQTLGVDEAWLSLGIKPTGTVRETKKQNAMATGAVNLVAGMIQVAGGSIAFPETPSENFDFYAIVRGRQAKITARLGAMEGDFKISIGTEPSLVVMVIPTEKPNVFEFVSIPVDLVEAHSISRGGFSELEINRNKFGLSIGERKLPVIRSFSEL